MANIGLNQLFPSARFLSTDSSGDVQEVTAQNGSNASASIQGIKIDAVALEEAGNGITFQIAESNGIADSISASNGNVTLSLKDLASNYKLGEGYTVDAVDPVDAVDAVSATASIQGIDITAVGVGTNGNGITFEITENQTTNSISASGNTVTLGLDNTATDYKLNEYSIRTDSSVSHTGISIGSYIYFIADDTLSMKKISDGSNTDVSFTAGSSYEVVDKDGTNRPIIEVSGEQYAFYVGNFKITWGQRLDSILTLLQTADTDVSSLVNFSITGNDSDNLTGTGSTITANGTDAIAGVPGVDAINNPSIKSIIESADTEVTNLVTLSIIGNDSEFLTGDRLIVMFSSAKGRVRK